jgi:hypothetical protein
MPPLLDLTGRKFGKLTVLRRNGTKVVGKWAAPTWLVKCACGRRKTVLGPNLRSGHAETCGCSLRPHGRFGTPEYRAWVSMIQRCENPKNQNYQRYGGRGISVCERWKGKGAFIRFFKDMGERPTPRHSLDRKDNNGNYEPGNCRWATKIEQSNNRRVSRVLTVGGVSATVSEWAAAIGVGKSTLKERLRRGWTAKDALLTPVAQTTVALAPGSPAAPTLHSS